MKEPLNVPITEALAGLERYDAILDARSPAEHAEDRLPGALSTPVLDDEERARIGTLHKQSPFEARRLGAALVARNIAGLLETVLAERPPSFRPLVYCWRGGNRSGALATVLARVGWRTSVLEGGYREYRRQVLAELAERPRRFRFVVLAGRTGSGKSAILQRLAALGAQVLDLEAIAHHRGSVLGPLPQSPQPSQRQFDSRIWSALRGFDAERPVYVESESKKVGERHVPDALIETMRASGCLRIEAPADVRCRLLLDEYRHFVDDPALLLRQLDLLRPLHGHAKIVAWSQLATTGRWEEFVTAMLDEHYDPAYDRSIVRNFGRITQAPTVVLEGADDPTIERTAREIIERVGL